jgi:DNA-binding transcriptional LysR family regulator
MRPLPVNRNRALDLAMFEALVEITQIGSITAAAHRLGYSQPGLSQRIQALERGLGCELLHRTGQGVRPTQVGGAVLPYARILTTVVEAMHQEIACRRPLDDHG